MYLTCSISYGVILYLDLMNVNKFKFKFLGANETVKFLLGGAGSPLQFFLHNNVPQALHPDTLYNKPTT
jgi:hypothetical protein